MQVLYIGTQVALHAPLDLGTGMQVLLGHSGASGHSHSESDFVILLCCYMCELQGPVSWCMSVLPHHNIPGCWHLLLLWLSVVSGHVLATVKERDC